MNNFERFSNRCWLNLENPEAAAILTPNVVLIGLTITIFTITLLGSSKDSELQNADSFTGRTETLQKNRSVMMAITALMSLGYFFGITSAHYQQDGLSITFMVVHLALALVILIFRVINDEQVTSDFKNSHKKCLFTELF